MRGLNALPLSMAAALVVVGCSVASDADTTAATESSLRELAADEIIGELSYGETRDVDYTPSPKYRAFSFKGEQNDQIQAQVVSQDATDPVLWLTDESFTTLSMNNDARATDSNSLISGRFLPKTGKYFLVFREMNGAARAKLSVSVRKLGVLPAECDPDGEGFISPDCTDPLGFDPFDPSTCDGEPLTSEAATTKFAGPTGLRLSGAKIFYRTHQCFVKDGVPDCAPWVRAFAMDVSLASIGATITTPPAAPAPPNTWSILPTTTTRKVKVDFTLEPTTTKQYCVDGPFTNLRASETETPDWTLLADATPGACGTNLTVKVTASCARFEPKPIRLSSGNPTYYTEFSSVLLAKY